uniref:Uncharacterized protein n=1 Tax=Arundo donax TaxID=35708 RepID=A0A0A9DC03_ARUDO
MPLPCDEMDRALFRASTQIILGDGNKALFCHDNWLHGKAPKELVPNLFALAKFKQRTVSKELQNNNWIRAVCRLSIAEQASEFINLWNQIQGISLSTEQKDTGLAMGSKRRVHSQVSVQNSVRRGGQTFHFQSPVESPS